MHATASNKHILVFSGYQVANTNNVQVTSLIIERILFTTFYIWVNTHMMNVVLDKVDVQGTVRVKYQPIQCSSEHKGYM